VAAVVETDSNTVTLLSLQEARANAEHIRNMGTLTMRQRSNDNADGASDANAGLANFLAAHAVKDDGEQ
jgi:hypothetical protein